MSVIAHISDLHFGASLPELEDCLIEQFTQHRPDVIVLSGDITQRATHRQYASARSFLHRLPCPHLTVPGNHDLSLYNLYERFHRPWKKWHRYISQSVAPEIHTGRLSIIGLNTAAQWGHRLNWVRGKISRPQIKRIEKGFRQAPPDRLRIIAAHHPFWLPESERHRHLVGGASGLYPILASSGIDLILGGHLHSVYTHIQNGTIICHAGSAISSRLSRRQKNSYNLISGDRHQLAVQEMQWQNKDFKPGKPFQFVKLPGGWERL